MQNLIQSLGLGMANRYGAAGSAPGQPASGQMTAQPSFETLLDQVRAERVARVKAMRESFSGAGLSNATAAGGLQAANGLYGQNGGGSGDGSPGSNGPGSSSGGGNGGTTSDGDSAPGVGIGGSGSGSTSSGISVSPSTVSAIGKVNPTLGMIAALASFVNDSLNLSDQTNPNSVNAVNGMDADSDATSAANATAAGQSNAAANASSAAQGGVTSGANIGSAADATNANSTNATNGSDSMSDNATPGAGGGFSSGDAPGSGTGGSSAGGTGTGVGGVGNGGPGDGIGGPGWAKGGIVTKKHLTGPNPKGKDDGYGALDHGEGVLTAATTKRLGGKKAIDALNAGLADIVMRKKK